MPERHSPESKGLGPKSRGTETSSQDVVQGVKQSIEGVKASGVMSETIKELAGPPLSMTFMYIFTVMDFFEHRDDAQKAAYCEGYAKAVTFASYGKDPQNLVFRFQEGESSVKVKEEELSSLSELTEKQHDKLRRTLYQNAFESGIAFYKGKNDAIKSLKSNSGVGKLGIESALNILYRAMAKNAGVREQWVKRIRF